jgi:hypothetical protein
MYVPMYVYHPKMSLMPLRPRSGIAPNYDFGKLLSYPTESRLRTVGDTTTYREKVAWSCGLTDKASRNIFTLVTRWVLNMYVEDTT